MRRWPGEVTRRDTLALGAGAATMLVVRPALGQSEAQAEVERHGMSGFGDLNQHGPSSIIFYTKVKTITERWPSGIKDGAEFVIPTMK